MKQPSNRLLELLSLSPDLEWSGGPEELAQVYDHQLNAPLFSEIRQADLDPPEHARLRQLAASLGIRTFRELLALEQAPRELICMVKDFAKAHTGGPGGGLLPREVATMLYYVSAAVGLLRHNDPQTEVGKPALVAGLQWAANQPWIDAATGDCLREALKRLAGTPTNPPG
jgi:hypothetical protein